MKAPSIVFNRRSEARGGMIRHVFDHKLMTARKEYPCENQKCVRGPIEPGELHWAFQPGTRSGMNLDPLLRFHGTCWNCNCGCIEHDAVMAAWGIEQATS